jgi:hypothetical protein
MFGVFANDMDNSVSSDYLALVANRFNAGPNFHPSLPGNLWFKALPLKQI